MNRPLRTAYLDYNRRYFDSKLPTDIDIDWIDSTAQQAYYDSGKRQIRICSKFKGWKSLWHMALLHEMVHVGGYMAHDAAFHAQMLRLARAGAFDRWW